MTQGVGKFIVRVLARESSALMIDLALDTHVSVEITLILVGGLCSIITVPPLRTLVLQLVSVGEMVLMKLAFGPKLVAKNGAFWVDEPIFLLVHVEGLVSNS